MNHPWQIRLFKNSIKKKRKFNKLKKFIGPLEKKRCLDVGCGTGAISYLLRQIGGEWTSIDSDMNCVLQTKNIVKDNVYKKNALSTGFKKDSFDVVVSLDLIEHIKDDEKFLKEGY